MYRKTSNGKIIETVWLNFKAMCEHYGYAPVTLAASRVCDIIGIDDSEYDYDDNGLHLVGYNFKESDLNKAFHRM